MIESSFGLEEGNLDDLPHPKPNADGDKTSLTCNDLQGSALPSDIQQLIESAMLYAEIYAEDQDLRLLTETAIAEWPV